MNKLEWTGASFGFASMAYMVFLLIVGNPTLNLASFSLWLAIDVLILVALFRTKAEGDPLPWLMIGYTVGTGIIVAILAYRLESGRSTFVWEDKEWWTLLAVIVAMLIWKITNDLGGVLASTTAMVLAGIPTWVDAFNISGSQDVLFWTLSGTGCALTYFGSQKKLVKRFMPACGALSNGLIIVLALQHHF